MKQYRVLRREGSIVGYAKWDEPSKYHPQGLVRDPMVPDEDPMASYCIGTSSNPRTARVENRRGKQI